MRSMRSARASRSPPDEVARVQAARALGLPVKLHADQLGSRRRCLAARFGALSADHLEYASEQGIQAMATAGTVAVLLPGAFYTLRERQQPPSSCCAGMACRSRWPPTAIPAPRPSPRSWPSSTWLHPVRTDARRGAGGGNPACRGPGLDDRGTLAVGSAPISAFGGSIAPRSSAIRLGAARTRTPGRPEAYIRAPPAECLPPPKFATKSVISVLKETGRAGGLGWAEETT